MPESRARGAGSHEMQGRAGSGAAGARSNERAPVLLTAGLEVRGHEVRSHCLICTRELSVAGQCCARHTQSFERARRVPGDDVIHAVVVAHLRGRQPDAHKARAQRRPGRGGAEGDARLKDAAPSAAAASKLKNRLRAGRIRPVSGGDVYLTRESQSRPVSA